MKSIPINCNYNSFAFSFISAVKVINFKAIIISFLCLYCLCICMAACVFDFVPCCMYVCSSREERLC